MSSNISETILVVTLYVTAYIVEDTISVTTAVPAKDIHAMVDAPPVGKAITIAAAVPITNTSVTITEDQKPPLSLIFINDSPSPPCIL